MRLKVTPIKQKPAMCGPTCIQMVLRNFGMKKPMAELINITGTTFKDGMRPSGFLHVARAYGLRATVKDHASLADIRRALARGVPPIINWFSTDEAHYSVAVELTKTYIVMIDPEDASVRRMPIKPFLRVWFGVSPEPARSKNDFHLRRMAILEPKTT
jgi:ABC-type bacteriocin/lantibiotic exporter with double-glycine peptidase domain